MSVKKLLVLAAAGLAVVGATAVMAGGPDHMAMSSPAVFENSVYLDLHAGYDQSNWTDFNSNNVMGASAVSAYAPSSDGKGGFTGGLDLGYNVTQYVAFEGSWFHLPEVTGKGTGAIQSTTTSQSASINSWVADLAAKLSVPVMENLDLFGKVGLAYRQLTYSLPSVASVTLKAVTNDGHYWTPLFGTGIQYTWNNWLFGAQYTYLPGDSTINHGYTGFGAPDAAPEANLYTGFVGYKFNV